MNAKYGNGIFLALFSLLVFCAFINTAFASTLYVPDDYSTIQAAVNAANAGDTIIVREGMYTENVDVNKSLTIKSENGSVKTVVQAADALDHIFEVTADYVTIKGFTVKKATGEAGGIRRSPVAGIFLFNAHYCDILWNNILNNKDGIYLQASGNSMLKSNNIFTNNRHGIRLGWSSQTTLSDNVISDNKYNFKVVGTYLQHFVHGIDESNKVNGKPIYYWVNENNRELPKDAGYVGIVNSNNITVDGLTLTNNGQGVLLANTTDSIIQGVTVRNDFCGIYLWNSINNTISNNRVINNFYGIQLDYSSANAIRDNSITETSGCGFFLKASGDNILRNNMMFENGGYNFGVIGSILPDFIQDIDTSNKVNGKPIYYLVNQSDLLINSSTFPDIGYLGVINSTTVFVNNLHLKNNNREGLLFAYTTFSIIENVTVSNSLHGLTLCHSHNNVIRNNTFFPSYATARQEFGITLFYSDNNDFNGNIVTRNERGIYMESSTNNTFSRNTISETRFSCGFNLWQSCNNYFYLNNFVNNAADKLSSSPTNVWSSSEPITYTYNGNIYKKYLGNYWSDYTEKYPDANEIDSTGIWDTPYSVDSDKDGHPLKVPFENYFAKPTPTPTPKLTVTPTLEPSPKPTVTPALEPIEDAFNYNGEYTLDQAKLREEEKKALPYVMKYANEYKVSPCLIMAVIRQESDFFDYSQDPEKDKTKFDIGYMQVSHIAAIDTYKEYTGDEYKGTEEEWQRDGLDLDINIKYGTRYLRIQYERIKDGHYKDVYNDILKSTLSAYNAGHPTKDNSKYVDGVIQGRDLIDGQRRGYEFFLTIRVPVGGVPVPEKSIPGFEVIFAIAEILAVAYLVRRRK